MNRTSVLFLVMRKLFVRLLIALLREEKRPPKVLTNNEIYCKILNIGEA